MTVAADEQVKLLLSSLKIYSPTTKEAPYASFLADTMERMGYGRVRIDRAGNVLGEVGKGKVSLLLCGHMDTVPGNLLVRKTKDSIYGRGQPTPKLLSAPCWRLAPRPRTAESQSPSRVSPRRKATGPESRRSSAAQGSSTTPSSANQEGQPGSPLPIMAESPSMSQ